MLAALVGRVMRTPVVVTEHGLGLWRLDAIRFRAAVQVAFRFASEIQCVAEATRRAKLELEHAPAWKTTVRYNCYADDALGDPHAGRTLRNDLGISLHAYVILFVGRLIDVKRPDLLMQAAGRVLSECSGSHLILAGDGVWRDRIESWAHSADVDERVHVLGTRSDMPAVYGASDVLALPSEREALSIALLESAASGMPSVAFDVGGNREAVVDGQTGYLCAFPNSDQFADCLVRLFVDTDGRVLMGERARKRAISLFSPKSRVQSLTESYEAAMRRVAP